MSKMQKKFKLETAEPLLKNRFIIKFEKNRSKYFTNFSA